MIQKIQEQHKQLYRDAQAGSAQAAASTKIWETSLAGVNEMLGKIGITLSLLKLINFVKDFTALAEQLNAVSNRTKISVENLDALRRIVLLNEGSFEDLTTGIRKLNISLAEAKNPNSEQAQIFKLLGVNATDTMGALLQLSDAFKNNLDPVNKNLVAQKLLGKSSEELINFLSLGSAEIRKQIEEQKKLGVISTETAKAADELRDRWGNLYQLLQLKIGEPAITALEFLEKQLESDAKILQVVIGFWNELYGTYQRLEKFGKKSPLGAATGGMEGAIPLASLGPHTEGSLEEAVGGKQIDVAKMLEAAKSSDKVAEALAKVKSEQGQAAKSAADLAREQNNLTRINQDLNAEVRSTTVALLDLEKQAMLAGFAHDKILTPALKEAVDKLFNMKEKAFEAAESQRRLTQYIEQANIELKAEEDLATITAEAWGFYAKSVADAQQKQLDLIETQRELGELAADRLDLLNKSQEADVARLQTRITYLQKIRELETDLNKQQVLDAQLLNAQTALSKIGQVTVDIGRHVGNTLNDIFTALISGTLKSVDIGKSALATLGRIGSDIFSQVIKDKLSFELNLFTNLKGLPGQATNAVNSGGGGGGILQQLLFGAGGSGGVAAGSNVFLPGQGGTPNLLEPGSIMSILGLAGGQGGGGGGIGGLFSFLQNFGFKGIGGAASSLGGFLSNLGGGQGISGLIQSGISTVGSLFGATGPGSVAIGSLITAAGTYISSISSTLGTIMSSVINTISTISAYIPYIGWIILAITSIYRIIANQQERPNARLSGQFGGVAFDPTSQMFVPGDINVSIGRKVGIKNSEASQIATNLQQRLVVLSNQWTDILNIFPDFLSEDIIPSLEETNRRLNQNFANLKFSPGGSRSIAQELEAMSGPDGLVRFFNAFQPSLAAGFRAALARAGTSVGTGGFEAISPGFKFPQADWDAFITAIKDVAGLTGQLATIGASKFLPQQDVSSLQSIFDSLFSVTDPKQFTKVAEALKEQLKPVLDFLNQSMQAGAELFGRGVMAALEAASESDAQLAFFNNLNQGIKDAVFKGIVDSFTASAEFSDLLAPLQKVIRESVESSLQTGQFDLAGFREKVLPAIEEILGRADVLSPLIGALQQFGSEINQRLGIGETVTKGLTDSAQLFGKALQSAMSAATGSEAMTNFTQAFNTGIRDAALKGLLDAFLQTGIFDEMLAPLNAAIKKMIAQSQETGLFTFDPEEFQKIINQVAAAAGAWEPWIKFLQDYAAAINQGLFGAQVNRGLSESADLFGRALMAAINAASDSEAMKNFQDTFNAGIRDAVTQGLIQSFLSAGFVDEMLAPIRAALKKMIDEGRATGTFVFNPDEIAALMQGAQAAAASWEPLIQFIRQVASGLGLTPPPPTTAPAAPTNVVINLNGVGNVDQDSIPDLARRINSMLAPELAPPT